MDAKKLLKLSVDMIPRAVVSLSTHVFTRPDNRYQDYDFPSLSESIRTTSVRIDQSPKWTDKSHGILEGFVNFDVTMFPTLSRFCQDIRHFIGLDSLQSRQSTWPPHAEDIDREQWIITTSYPILPEGRESEIALARVKYPIVHIRIPMMGLEYIKALSMLSYSNQITEEFNNEDQWFLPDVDEFVDFTLDESHTFHKL